MPNFKDVNSLEMYLRSKIPISLTVIGEEIKKKLRENIQNLWYDRDFTPTHYTRTMEYIESLRCSEVLNMGNGQYQVRIYFATHAIIPHSTPYGEWNQHAGVNYEDVSASIPSFIEYGNNSPLYSYQGVHPVETTKQWAKDMKIIQKRMVELLKKYGFSCSIT